MSAPGKERMGRAARGRGGRPGLRRARLAPVVLAAVAAAAWSAQARAGEADAAGDAVRGQRLFLQCQACHARNNTAGAAVGPALGGVVGRKAGTLAGYSFSSALAASGLTWDEATLDQWLEHPNGLVPGTKMIFSGVANRADRLSIIAYLKTIPSTDAK